MIEALNQYGSVLQFRRGEIMTGIIIGKNDFGFLVDIGFRVEGFLPMREYTNHSLVEKFPEPVIGEEIKVEIISIRDGYEAQLLLSRWRYEFDKRWADIETKISQSDDKIFTVKGLEKVKGGLSVEFCGIKGFIPMSHLATSWKGANPSNFVGYNIKVKILEHDKRKHSLIFSRREFLEEIKFQEKLMQSIYKCEIYGLMLKKLEKV